MKKILIYSSDLINFVSLEKTEFDHYNGGIEIFHKNLIAIGGERNKVEVLNNISNKWETKSTIGNNDEVIIYGMSTMVLKEQ